MKRFASVLSVSLCVSMLARPAEARVGESPIDCQKRYGEAIKADKEKNQAIFQKGGLVIVCSFRESKCVSIVFFKDERNALGRPVELSDNEIQTLLEANSSGQKWKVPSGISIDKNFVTEDGQLLATYGNMEHALMILTKEESERMNKEQADKEKQKLKDF